MIFNLEEG